MSSKISRTITGTVILGVALSMGLTGGSPAVAATDGHAAVAVRDGVPANILAAVQRDLGLTAEQATVRLAQEAKAIKLDTQLRGTLGSRFAGSWFDASSGRLVVAVTSAQAAAGVTATGALALVVKHSEATLQGIVAKLDGLAGRIEKSTPGSRTAAGKRSSAVEGLASWRIDPISNSVVVTAVKGTKRAAALDTLAAYGDAVQVAYTDSAPQTAANWLDGGDVLSGICSNGFNLRNTSTGQGFLITAGHCFTTGTGVSGQGGVYFGPTVSSWFPTFDDALVRNDNAGYWIQGPWIDTSPSNGGFATVVGTSDGPVGTSVCKSGITTLLTCGTITAKRETVNYSQGPVYNMTRHNACVEPGDSGGSNVAASGVSAEGVTSGAQLYWDGSRYRCGAVFGYANVSWYFPIVISLGFYGPAYGVSIW